ncbi:hypothetical protein EK21DRAFT_87791 [Setomelanomma holmii]|uniref:Uncharacterized protein n=1 Tax=Setomelanomma holmii TaxID=210430 RepID=A0A9P4LN78_9PLEO|nr:hypothetical protein EK21DRAFT_87791 [Setomelanomma holmii]
MPAARRSRLQFPKYTAKLDTKSKARRESKVQNEPSASHRDHISAKPAIATAAHRTRKPIDQAATVAKEMEWSTSMFEDTTEEATEGMPNFFSKSRVPSMVELASMGHLRRELGIAANALDSDSTDDESATTIAVDWADSPSQSLILQAPVCVVRDGELREVHQPEIASSLCASLARTLIPSSTFLQTLVNLFAGRKRVRKKEETTIHPEAEPVSTDAPSNAEISQLEEPHQPIYEIVEPSSPIKCLPRLTHRQVIPQIIHPDADRRAYKDISAAPAHKHFGRADLAEDIFTPSSIQRGFRTPSRTPSPPLGHRRNHSTSRLLDRDRDVWACWHSKHSSPESSIFSRTSSAVDMMKLRTVNANGIRGDRISRHRIGQDFTPEPSPQKEPVITDYSSERVYPDPLEDGDHFNETLYSDWSLTDLRHHRDDLFSSSVDCEPGLGGLRCITTLRDPGILAEAAASARQSGKFGQVRARV